MPAKGGYVTESVDRGAITATVTATGTVQPVSTVQVGTYVSGPIQAIYVDFNSPVTSGQLVAKIDPAPFEVKVRQAEANLANARASVEKARADLRAQEAHPRAQSEPSHARPDLAGRARHFGEQPCPGRRPARARGSRREAGRGRARGSAHHPRLHGDPLAGRRRRHLAQRRRRPDRRRELPDADAVRDRAGPHEDAGERQRERVRHRRRCARARRRASASTRIRAASSRAAWCRCATPRSRC